MSKSKGNAGEIQVAKLLKPWWCKFEQIAPNGKPVNFVRVPLSGGWVYGESFAACGDIMTNAPRFPFSVEVKRVEKWSLQVLLDAKPSPVWAFWRQCLRDASKTESEPMLWFRKNRMPWLVMLRQEYINGLNDISDPDVIFARNLRYKIDCEVQPVIYLGDNFLSNSPSMFAVG